MWWKVKRSEWDSQKGETNRRAMRAYVDSGARPGLIAFAGREPVGWIAVEPRKNYPVLTRSRMLKTLDDAPVWSITCFFVRRDFRNRGVARALIRAAVEHVARKKGRLVEAYPVAPKTDRRLPDAFAWHGLDSMFLSEGFYEVARPSATRSVVRLHVANERPWRPGRPRH